MKAAFACAVLFCIVCLPNAVAQSIYKWVDDNGVTHFSEQRPDGVEAERLSVRVHSGAGKSSKSPAVASTPARQSGQKSQPASAEDPDKAQRDAEMRQENCARARERLKTYETSRRLYRELEDGEREYLDSAELDAARAEARQLVADWCD